MKGRRIGEGLDKVVLSGGNMGRETWIVGAEHLECA